MCGLLTLPSRNAHFTRNIAPMPMRHLTRILFMAGGILKGGYSYEECDRLPVHVMGYRIE